MALGGYDGTIKIDSSIDTKGFNAGIQKISSLIKPLVAIIVTAFGIKAVGAVAKLSAEFDRLAIAAQAVGQLYGKTAEATRQTVAELVDSGIQSNIANKAYINFAREGLDLGLLPSLARGAQDLNVFAEAGSSSSDVFDRLLHGVLTLNPLILRNAGAAVDLDEAYRNYAKTLGTTANALTTAQKRSAALVAVTEKLKGVTGLYELSQQTAAGQLASNIRVMNEFKAALGAPLLQAFYYLIKGWNSLVKAMTASIKVGGRFYEVFVHIGALLGLIAQAIGTVFAAIASLFGVAVKPAQQTADTMGGVADATNEAADAQDNLAGATENAAEKAKGALAAFDQLNVLQQPSDNTGGGAGGLGGDLAGGGGFDLGAVDPSQFASATDAIKAKMEELRSSFTGTFDKLKESFGRVVEALKPLGQKIWEGLKWAWDNILVPLSEWVVNEALPVLLDALAAALDILNLAIEALEPLWTWLWENVIQPLGEAVGDALINIMLTLVDALKELKIWIENNQEAWQIIVETLALVALAFLVLNSPIAAIIVALLAIIYVAEHWGEIWGWITTQVSAAWETMKQVWAIAGWWFQSNVIDPIKNGFKTAWDSIKTSFKSTFDSIKSIARSTINSIIDVVNGMIGGVQTAINNVIYAANTAGSIIPGYSQIGYVSLPRIPRLATGAVIPPNSEFIAMLGDQRSGRNIEAPEALIRQLLDEKIGNLKAEIAIEFTGNLASLARELSPEISRQQVFIGKSLVKKG